MIIVSQIRKILNKGCIWIQTENANSLLIINIYFNLTNSGHISYVSLKTTEILYDVPDCIALVI
jgi:hypothetical protein